MTTYSYPLTYAKRNTLKAPIVVCDLYSDGTTLSKSRFRSANPIRIRLVNVRGYSGNWHEVVISPSMQYKSSYYDPKLALKRSVLFQRFLFLLFENIFTASCAGVVIDGVITDIRINMIVAEQKQERAFLCLKSVGIFMECSLCVMPTRRFMDDDTDEDSCDEFFVSEQGQKIYDIQNDSRCAVDSDVVRTVLYLVYCAAYKLPYIMRQKFRPET